MCLPSTRCGPEASVLALNINMVVLPDSIAADNSGLVISSMKTIADLDSELFSARGCFDETKWFIGRDENFVAILHAHSSEVKRQMMLVRHAQADLASFFAFLECGLAHRIQRVLNRFAEMIRKGSKQGFAHEVPVLAKVKTALLVTPLRLHHRGE